MPHTNPLDGIQKDKRSFKLVVWVKNGLVYKSEA